ncbi:MAG: tRNA epoxyqueuosine(34) reductase QueG [Verrucomicrobiae bacterium]|nr:tRNA epoxyqueuosine(34) reductase QueG [Verrucomicrobiae bacterium]
MSAASPIDGAAKERLRAKILSLGFDAVGFTSAGEYSRPEALKRWVAAGRHGEMAWMERNLPRRLSLAEVMPEARSVVVVGLNYLTPEPAMPGGVTARYSRAEDYHFGMESCLKQVEALLRDACEGDCACRSYVDTGPLQERELAWRAGLGWQGKSTVLISRAHGTWLLLGEVLTSAVIAPDEPAAHRCGSCRKCVDACPTNAIVADYELDARRCIAYLTIELKGAIPLEFREAVGARVFGCDDCLAACPWNRFARESSSFQSFARSDLARLDLLEVLAMDSVEFLRKFRRTPIHRLGLRRLQRNAAVVLGNIGGEEALAVLRALAGGADELLAEHAAWAIDRIGRRTQRAVDEAAGAS